MIPILTEVETRGSPEPPPVPKETTSRQRAELEVRRARPDLAEGSEERRAAVLLLLAGGGGLNVDRLVARTRYPRDFVARCVRRLVDNGWLVDGLARRDWGQADAACDAFWWDVGVALGRMLRRTGEDGRLEWAPVGEWVKHFEYSAPPAREGEMGNHYREIRAYSPEPEVPLVDVPSSAPDDPTASPRERTSRTIQPPSAQLPRVRRTDHARVAQVGGGGMLVDGWGAAEWLG